MSSRPAATTKHRRPLSAIFLGNPPQLPDLPEPPNTASSPGSGLGLPSPPASNSTGSGSNGGDLSNESVRLPRSVSLMNNVSGGSVGNRARSVSRSRSPSEDGEGVDDEDHTARLSGGPSGPGRSNMDSNESALQRVKSLTQRNRLVLNKLASLSTGSRLATPSPSTGPRRSPAPSTANSVASSSRLTRRRSESISRASGSETERENANDSNNAASDSEGHSETPTSTTGTHFRSASLAERQSSGSSQSKQDQDGVPERPARGRSVELDGESTRSRRYSNINPNSRPQSRADDIEAAALAAVAQSRRDRDRDSPVETRRRQPLPREFLSNSNSSDSLGHPPQTPRRERTVSGSYSVQESPSSSRATLHDSPMSPRTRLQRYSTIREMARRNQTRWLSQDLSPLKNGTNANDESPTKRGDTGDSPRRNFVGESLRAAGLVKLREEGDDVFGGGGSGEAGRRLRISSEVGVRPAGRLEGATSSRPGTRFSERPVASDTERHTSTEPRTPHYAIAQRNVQTAVKNERPASSLERYREEQQPHTAPPAQRSQRSAYTVTEGVERDRQEAGGLSSRPSSQLRHFAISGKAAVGHERSGSVLGGGGGGVRHLPASPLNLASAAAGDGTPEHARLMLESLGMFESQLSRLPSLGSTTTVTIPELFRSAQNIVHATDALSNMLRRGTAHALEEQIDAELGEDGRAIDLVSLWRDVGAEYRESVRVSDELVRTMTSFLLGVGKVLREATATAESVAHSRTMSLDGESPRRRLGLDGNGPPPNAGGLGDGSRRSESTRLSSEGNRSSLDGKSTTTSRWIVSSGDTGMTGRTSTSFTSLHSASSTSLFRPSASSSRQQLIDAESINNGTGESGIASRKLARMSATVTGSRHLAESPLDSRGNISLDEGPADLPSVAAAARRDEKGTLSRRSNTVTAPPPLSTLPSESLLSRRSTEKPASISSRRPRTSGGFPTLTPSTAEPTTAVNTTQASPERPRHVSTSSMGVSRTFGRTGGAGVAAGMAAKVLQQSMERDVSVRKRTASVSSVVESDAPSDARGQRDPGAEDAEREPRARASLDSATSGTSRRTATRTGTFSRQPARERRGTVTSLFSRS